MYFIMQRNFPPVEAFRQPAQPFARRLAHARTELARRARREKEKKNIGAGELLRMREEARKR